MGSLRAACWRKIRDSRFPEPLPTADWWSFSCSPAVKQPLPSHDWSNCGKDFVELVKDTSKPRAVIKQVSRRVSTASDKQLLVNARKRRPDEKQIGLKASKMSAMMAWDSTRLIPRYLPRLPQVEDLRRGSRGLLTSRHFCRSALHDRLKIRPKDGFADYIYEGTLTKICNPTRAI